jgi:low affinity Fe/Cu permease
LKRRTWYSHFAKASARATGRPITFIVAALVIVITGPIFRFNATWQEIVQTVTAIVTFLMVFIIQNTQNRDTEAIHIKLDELIRSTQGARNELMDLEELEPKELDEYRNSYERLAAAARSSPHTALETGTPEP